MNRPYRLEWPLAPPFIRIEYTFQIEYNCSLQFRVMLPRLQSRSACRAPVAQMDRALASGAKGRGFESLLARHFIPVQPGHIGDTTYRLHG